MLKPPSIADIERLAAEAWQTIPVEFRAACGDVVIRVVDFPDDEAPTKRTIPLKQS